MSSARTRPVRHGRPQYTGLTTYQDPLGRFEFKHASDWFRDQLADDREGAIFLFEKGVTDSYFAVWVTDLGERVRDSDLETLREGFDSGLRTLPDLQVEESDEELFGHIIRLDRRYTCTEDGETRKRRVRTVYADHWQIVLVFQGATVEEYAYWEPMGNFAFMRFDLSQALWFLSDPDRDREQDADQQPAAQPDRAD